MWEILYGGRWNDRNMAKRDHNLYDAGINLDGLKKLQEVSTANWKVRLKRSTVKETHYQHFDNTLVAVTITVAVYSTAAPHLCSIRDYSLINLTNNKSRTTKPVRFISIDTYVIAASVHSAWNEHLGTITHSAHLCGSNWALTILGSYSGYN
jgi:hypothetical protein